MDANGLTSHQRIPGAQMIPLGKDGDLHMETKVPTVDEALPYSPLSSILPFNTDIIPLPTIGLGSSSSYFANDTEREAGRRGLESLNQEALYPSHTSRKLQRSLDELRQLLRPECITKFKFKHAPRLPSEPVSAHALRATVSPFAQMVLDTTSVNFQSLNSEPFSSRGKSGRPSPVRTTPEMQQGVQQNVTGAQSIRQESPRSVVGHGNSAMQFMTAPKASISHSRIAVLVPSLPENFKREEYAPSQLQAKHKHDSVLAIAEPHFSQSLRSESSFAPIQTSKLQQPTPLDLKPTSIPKVAVVIPDLPATFCPDEYLLLPKSPDTPEYLSQKRRSNDATGYDNDISLSVDQREKSDAAFRSLREYIQDIFEAEDQFQLTSTDLLVTINESRTLSALAHAKIDSFLQRVISLDRFSQAPLDDLLRLQKMCEAAIREAETVDVRIDENMTESEIETWLQQLPIAELGLKSARTSLRLMSGDREDKKLYSEDAINSTLAVFKNVMDSCIIPIVEMRSTGSSSTMFKLLTPHKKLISSILTQCRRLLSLLATLVSHIDLSEAVINTLEFSSSQLIFVENAHFEKDSILGAAKFDSLRVVAMDVLAQIFLTNPAQRPGIFDEILTSLEKLPVTRQSARQFKLQGGGSIQLVSALIMRLIQTSATKSDETKSGRRLRALEALNGDEKDNVESSGTALSLVTNQFTIISEAKAEKQVVTAIQELEYCVTPLLDTAKANATYVVGFIVNRAMNSTKSGDTPYRNLLDLFVEDFITCLNSVEWPAAELLLRLFLFKMVHLAEGDKTPAPAKNMALDLLGLMGAAISELNSQVRRTAATVENGNGDLGKYLSRLADASLDKRASPVELLSWACGPFRASLEFLEERCSEDPQLNSAISLLVAEWASKICNAYESFSEENDDYERTEQEYGRLAYRLRTIIGDKKWLSTEYSFDSVSPGLARLAYSLTLLNSHFCESFGRVLTILLGSMTSEQATVRSKSLKSVNQVLDTDPTIIDREPAVKSLILRCSNDQSVQVRDSALGLIGKCISLRPMLEEEMMQSVLQRVNDSGVGVRKRAIKLAKDIYLRNQNGDMRSLIADALLHRVSDVDDGVQELARQTIEEVWMSPFYQPTTSDDTSAQFKLAMVNHVALMIQTVQRSSGVSIVLDKVLQNMLSSECKLAAANLRVCKGLVATMFETIIDNPTNQGNGTSSSRDALIVLTVFAKANAKLFTPEQVQLLQPYIAHVGGGDDLSVYRSVVIIFRHVLPHLSKAHNSFLASVRKELMPAISRMGRTILDDIIACLWIISEVLDDFQHLTRLVLSSLSNIEKEKNTDLNDPKLEVIVRKVSKLLVITGMCGKHCDFDSQRQTFRAVFPTWKDDSVSKLMTDMFAPFASPSQPLEVRKAALDAIGMVCQSWPKNFSSKNIYTVFSTVFTEDDSFLEAIVLRTFKDFLLLEEKRSEAGNEATIGAAGDPTAKLGVMGGSQGDGIAISIAQRFLDHIIRIALSRQDDQGLLATEVIASIARQGLVHPKSCGAALIALETSQNTKIADVAFHEHRAMHEKHETILEKEYMRAVQMAYNYQRDIVKDTHGATFNPFASKLAMMVEVMKISKPKNRKRFFENLCNRIDFEPAKLKDLDEVLLHLDFAQFIIENLAFFEYVSVDELLSTITAMEKLVASAGTGTAHAIETEIFQLSLEPLSQIDETGQLRPVQRPIDQTRFRQLTACSIMLSCLWEARTYLRRQYGLMTSKQASKSKGPSKDLSRAPIRAQGVNGDKFWETISSIMSAGLDTEDHMMTQCRSFVDLLSVDHDFKVSAEADDGGELVRPTTPSDEDQDGTPAPPSGSGRGRKRKAVVVRGNRNKRARSSSAQRSRGRPAGSGKRGSMDKSDDDGENFH